MSALSSLLKSGKAGSRGGIPGFNMTLKSAKAGFFDRKRVIDAVDKAGRKVLSKFGAFVRQRAKSSIRQRKGASRPGTPPHSHTGLLKKFIFFSWDDSRKSVVIGPTLLRPTSDVPRVLEYGGIAPRIIGGMPVKAAYPARPYMRPAFQQELPVLDELWKNSVK